MARWQVWVAGGLALGLLVLVVVQSRRSGDSPRAPVGEPVEGAYDRGAGKQEAAPAATGHGRADRALAALEPAQVWRAQVARAVQKVAQERLGHALLPESEARLVDALASVGPAARRLDRDSLDPDDPASIEGVRADTAALVEADRVCRATLGVGVTELIRSLDPSRIEDQAPPSSGRRR